MSDWVSGLTSRLMSGWLEGADPLEALALVVLLVAVLASAVAVVTRRNPVAAVAWLVVHFVATAGVYIVLNSEFVAAMQVLVYAGAIIVLFLFVVMLLSDDRMPDVGVASGIGRKTLVVGLLLVLVVLFARLAPSSVPAVAEPGPNENTVVWLGHALFSEHLVAFELASVPLLAAMAGVLVYTTRRVAVRRSQSDQEEEK